MSDEMRLRSKFERYLVSTVALHDGTYESMVFELDSDGEVSSYEEIDYTHSKTKDKAIEQHEFLCNNIKEIPDYYEW